MPALASKRVRPGRPVVRARRRTLEARARGEAADEAAVLADILKRDERDKNRAVAPLKPAPDADRTAIGSDLKQRTGPYCSQERRPAAFAFHLQPATKSVIDLAPRRGGFDLKLRTFRQRDFDISGPRACIDR